MFSIPSLYEMGMGMGTLPDSHYSMLQENVEDPRDELMMSPSSIAEAKALAASNSHKEAERRRRKRINAHIATLRSILPNTIKTDKASLLGETVRQVKELKKTTAELAASSNADTTADDSSSQRFMFPSETDELQLCHCEASDIIKATLSCEDRPEMIPDLIHAVKSAEAKVVRTEMSTVGGRTKMVLWVKLMGEVDSGTLKRALKMAMDKSTLSAGSGQGLPESKRPRHHHGKGQQPSWW